MGKHLAKSNICVGFKVHCIVSGLLTAALFPLSPLHPPPSLTFPALFLTHTHTRGNPFYLPDP